MSTKEAPTVVPASLNPEKIQPTVRAIATEADYVVATIPALQ